MATMTERLRFVFEADTKSVEKAFGKVRTEASSTAGVAGSKMDALKGSIATVGPVAIGAGVVVGGALVKMAGNFEKLALDSGKFADATGLNVEDASRWIEVAGDMGVSTEELEGALGKMNKTLGASPAKFEQFGVTVGYAKDGTVDANQTFLNTIDTLRGMKDPALKAAAASALLGKGWQSMAELINAGSGTLKKSLDDVADVKVISKDELAKAREYRKQMDDLHDSIEEVGLVIGQTVLPVIGDLAEGLSGVVDAAGPIPDILGKIYQYSNPLTGMVNVYKAAWGGVNDVLHENIDVTWAAGLTTESATGRIVPNIEGINSALVRNGKGFGTWSGQAAAAADEAKAKTEQLEAAWDKLLGRFDDDRAILDLQDSFAQVEEAGKAAMEAAAKGSEDADAKARDYQRSLFALRDELALYYKDVMKLPPEQVTKIMAQLDGASASHVAALLDAIAKSRTVNFYAADGKAQTGAKNTGGKPGKVQALDDGGIVAGPVGSPQVVIAHGGETVLPTHKGPVAIGGDTTIQLVVDGRVLAEAVRRADRALR